MKFKNLYEVSHNEKTGNHWYTYIIHIEAFNMKEAKQIVKELWYDYSKHHMFNIKVKRVPLDARVDLCHWFKCVNVL